MGHNVFNPWRHDTCTESLSVCMCVCVCVCVCVCICVCVCVCVWLHVHKKICHTIVYKAMYATMQVCAQV